MNLSKNDLDELTKLQPKLVVIGNQISGHFYLSASLVSKSKNRGSKINCYSWDYKSKDKNHMSYSFDIDITLDENLYPIKACSQEILSWKNEIPEEYWHINPNNSICLGEKSEIEKLQKQYSFPIFINVILMQYFYYMNYTKSHKNEPWKGHRHGLFAALEIAYKDIGNNQILINRHIEYGKKEWDKLIVKTKGLKINKVDNCPFCVHKILVKNCARHGKQIKGYNNRINFIKTKT